MFDGFDIGDAFGAGIIGGFIDEAVGEEDEKLQKLRRHGECDQDGDYDEESPVRIGSTPGGTGVGYLDICNDSDNEENLTEIKKTIDDALAYADSKLSQNSGSDFEEKEGAGDEGSSGIGVKTEGPVED